MPKIVNNTTFPNPLDLIAPHSCLGCGYMGSILCNRCKKNILTNRSDICPNCKDKTVNTKCKNCTNLPPIYIIGERQDLIGKLVHDYKYHSIHALAKPLSELMGHILPTTDNPTTIVPLPTINKHIRTRGLDHTYLIAKHLAKIKSYKLERLIVRAKDTVQVGANIKTRSRQASEAYIIKKNTSINPSVTYLLFDDVWTTGASMQSAIKKLQQAGAEKIIVGILALSRIN